MTLLRVAICTLAAVAVAVAAAAQPPSPGATRVDDPAAASPAAPGGVSRENGAVIVRAVRLAGPLRIDGRLDDEIYGTVPPVSDFIQTVPAEGEPATEKTDAWIMYDAENIYVAGRCWDSAPPQAWVANELRRDSQQLRENDSFGVMFDTFFDRRNAFAFYTTPLGALADQAFTDEGNPNRDWNPVWQVRTGRFDGGWTVEMAIPFKSLRYRSGTGQTWGINFRRSIRRRNEWTHLTLLPASLGGSTAWFRVSGSATLVGLDLPDASRNIEVKPYGISRVTTDLLATPVLSNDHDPDFGVDAKYGITANLTADITFNTDFAQVEVDEQQVNLTRFALSFPEKRDFFLEGRGIFDFGRGAMNFSGGPPGGGGGGGMGGVTPTLFYSRRIGLNRNRVVPLQAGGRITGKVGQFAVGLLNIQTEETREGGLIENPATNFTVVRVKRDILRRSSVGAIFTNRSVLSVGEGSNQALGADAAFSFFQNVNIGGYYARTETPGLSGDDDSYQGRFDYGADRYGARFEYLKVGDNFNPEVGLVRRDDFRRSFGALRFSPRPRSIAAVRKFTWEANVENFQNGAGQTETRILTGRFNTELESSDQVSVEVANNDELLLDPFQIAGVDIPAGRYRFTDVQFSYFFGQQRPASGTASLQVGRFYDGTITAVGISGARVSLTDRLSVEPSLSINRVERALGDFTTRLVRARTDYAFTPRMFASALIQYSSSDDVFSNNLRFRWEYHPGSELFVVYTDERDTRAAGFPSLRNRAFVVKVNRLFRF